MLTVEHVGKTYPPAPRLLRLIVQTAHNQPVNALRDVTFDVSAGEIVGLVGPNGAGKSTLIRMCSTLLEPTTGSITVDGVDLADDPRRARARIGLFLNDDRAMYLRMTGRQNLRFFGVMVGLTPQEARRRAEELLEEFDLAHRDRRVFGYSSGMLVRLGLARALLADPPLLILDEPSRSLDPVASDAFMRQLRRLADHGRAVLLSNHRLDEIQSTCDRVLVIANGRQRAWGATADLAPAGREPADAIRHLLSEDEEG